MTRPAFAAVIAVLVASSPALSEQGALNRFGLRAFPDTADEIGSSPSKPCRMYFVPWKGAHLRCYGLTEAEKKQVDLIMRYLSALPAAAQPASLPTAEPRAGDYVVQVSSQRTEAEAQASYRWLQGKYPSVLGDHSVLIKRFVLGKRGVYYRANIGPFKSDEEARAMCARLKDAGGQCVVQRN